MTFRHPVLRLPAALLLVMLTRIAHAEQMQDYGDYVVQYNAMHNMDLSPAIARQYGVTRSSRRGLVVITVQKKVANKSEAPAVPAKVSGVARNITGQTQVLALREVREGSIIYYLAEIPVENLDLMTFDLQIQPEGSELTLPLKFQQRFYVDE